MSTDRTPIDRAAEASFKAGAENAARELGLATPVQWANLRAGDQEHVRIQARAAVSAALTNDADPDWLAKKHYAAWRKEWPGTLTWETEAEFRRDEMRRHAAVSVAAILGADS